MFTTIIESHHQVRGEKAEAVMVTKAEARKMKWLGKARLRLPPDVASWLVDATKKGSLNLLEPHFPGL
jgi:hypothetical protein